MTDVYIDEDKIAESYVEMKKYDGSVYDILEVTKGNVKLVFELLCRSLKRFIHFQLEIRPCITEI